MTASGSGASAAVPKIPCRGRAHGLAHRAKHLLAHARQALGPGCRWLGAGLPATPLAASRLASSGTVPLTPWTPHLLLVHRFAARSVRDLSPRAEDQMAGVRARRLADQPEHLPETAAAAGQAWRSCVLQSPDNGSSGVRRPLPLSPASWVTLAIPDRDHGLSVAPAGCRILRRSAPRR